MKFITPAVAFFKKYKWIILGAIVITALVGGIEWMTGRSLLGPDGMFGWWDGDIWSSENSQRVADAYTFLHIIHGLLFYGFLFLVAKKLPVRYRFLIALCMEGGWELLENSPLIIDRYRAVTISLGYVGDSVLNSVCDVVWAGLGFFLAYWWKVWISVVFVIVLELGCLFWVRDNLTLNVLMLVSPVESVREWQSFGHENLTK